VTQTYEVVLTLKSRPPGLTLLPGMSVTVLPFSSTAPTAAKSPPADAALSIPLTAVVSDATGGTFVWVVGAGGQVTRSNVALGAIRGGDVTVASGLNAGERIVTAGVSALREGMKVRPLDAR
jgi:multidrug efflux pump subunit AcrA (membrane-fusion protein)